MLRINWRLTARSRSRLRFARRKGLREQETEPGTLVTGPIPVTTSAPWPLRRKPTGFHPLGCAHSYQPVAKVMQERKMGTATNSPPVMTQETKHLA